MSDRIYPTLKADRDAAALTLAAKQARVTAYVRKPARDANGKPLPMPLRFTIALNTAQKRYDLAEQRYIARYGRTVTA